MKILNKAASANYKIEDKFESGIVLLGSEVKAIRQGHADLMGSYVKVVGSEAYLINAKIFPYEFARVENYDEGRSRKLLLHKKEIIALKARLDQGNMTIVPLSLYITKEGLIKLEIGLVKGKRKFEKKRQLKEKDIQREVERELKKMGKI